MKETPMTTHPNQPGLFTTPDEIERNPIRPYAGDHGDAGGNRGKTTLPKAQAEVVQHLTTATITGHTVKELCTITGRHHGSVSGSLSELHRGGIIQRLTTQRQHCSVYVLPQYVLHRTTIAPAPTKAALGNLLAEHQTAIATAITELETIADWLDGYENGRSQPVHAVIDLLERLTTNH